MSQIWDAVVVGAGPAGSVAARELARLGRSVLLIDKATFPRGKVCGCCLNESALASLQSVGLGSLTTQCQSVPLNAVRLGASNRQVQLPLPGGESLSRTSFDQALINAAIQAGVEFRSGITVKLGELQADHRQLLLQDDVIRTRVVIAADGLNGTLLQQERPKPILRPDSRIGAGVMLKDYPQEYGTGTIFMAVGRGGYVGLVRVEGDQLDLAAAFDPSFVKQSGGLGPAAESILQQAGFPPIPQLAGQPWRGTPALTRTPQQLAGPRWFAIGDAAGYVEPFTGEGMAWAVASGIAVAPLAAQDWRPQLAQQWTRVHAQRIRSRQGVCRALATLLRSPQLCGIAIRALAVLPALARPVMARLNRPVQTLTSGVPS